MSRTRQRDSQARSDERRFERRHVAALKSKNNAHWMKEARRESRSEDDED